jgi:hypothetical protein
LGKKGDSISKSKLGMMVNSCNPSYVGGRLRSKDGLAKPYLKNKQKKGCECSLNNTALTEQT